jgi:hypothetical protein
MNPKSCREIDVEDVKETGLVLILGTGTSKNKKDKVVPVFN